MGFGTRSSSFAVCPAGTCSIFSAKANIQDALVGENYKFWMGASWKVLVVLCSVFASQVASARVRLQSSKQWAELLTELEFGETAMRRSFCFWQCPPLAHNGQCNRIFGWHGSVR